MVGGDMVVHMIAFALHACIVSEAIFRLLTLCGFVCLQGHMGATPYAYAARIRRRDARN